MSKIQLMNLSVSPTEVQVQEQEATKGGVTVPFPWSGDDFQLPQIPPLPWPIPGPTNPIPPIITWPY